MVRMVELPNQMCRPKRNWHCFLPLLGLLLVGCGGQPQTIAPSPVPTIAESPIPTPTVSPTDIPSPTPTPSASAKPAAVQTLETRLKTVLTEAIAAPVEDVNCRAAADIKPGSPIPCEAKTRQQPFSLTAELVDTKGNFNWTAPGLIILSNLETSIQQVVKDRSGISVTADCGESIRVANPGDSFQCRLSDAQGQSRSLNVAVKDNQGNVEISLQ